MNNDLGDNEQKSAPNFPIALKLMSGTRWFSLIAVISSLVGAILMFAIGLFNTIKAIIIFFGLNPEIIESVNLEPAENTNLILLESLDNCLTGLTFLYFAYGIYSLFLANKEMRTIAPESLQVKSLAELKKTLLEVVVVLLSIIFVRYSAKLLVSGELYWQILILPLSIVAIALSSKLMDEE